MSKAFGEQNPTLGEDPVSWQTWSDGAGGIPDVQGNIDWGKLELDLSGEEGRSAIYDMGSAITRQYTLTENRYGVGSGSAALQIRGDVASFTQDDNVVDWEDYTVPISRGWRYVQVRETTFTYYYVDATLGDDGHPGTRAEPWQTIAKVNAAALNPGDCVLFKRGETWTGEGLQIPSSGLAGQYIVFGAYGTGNKPKFNGTGLAFGNGIRSGLLAVDPTPRNYIIVENIEVYNYAEMGIRFDTNIATDDNSVGSHHVIIQNCDVHDNVNVGIYIMGGDPAVGGEAQYISILNNTCYHGNIYGIKVAGLPTVGIAKNITISGNTCYTALGASNSGAGIATSTGLRNSTISYNTCHSNGEDGLHTNNASGIIIEYNVCYSNGVVTAANGHGIKILATSNTTVRYNRVYSNTASGIYYDGELIADPLSSVFHDNLIYYNGTAGSTDAGIKLANTTIAHQVYHNTLLWNHIYGLAVRGGVSAKDHLIKNNIIHSIGGGQAGDHLIYIKDFGSAWTANKIDYNLYYSTDLTNEWDWRDTAYTDFALYQAASGQDTNSIEDNPDFVTEYTDLHLLLGSPCIGTGDPTVGPYNDYDDVVRGVAVDIGAYEYVP